MSKTNSKNPRENANIFSILLFFWILPFFKRGYKKSLDINDIPIPLNVDRSQSLGDRLYRSWQKQTGQRYLHKAVFRTFLKEYLILSVLSFINNVSIRLSLPFLLGRLLLYFRMDAEMKYSNALLYAAGFIINIGINALTSNHYVMASFHNSMKVKIAVCNLIYRKALRLSQTALLDTPSGKIVNLLSNDVNRFDYMSIFLNALWIAPLLWIITGYLLWLEAGWAGIIGVAIIVVTAPIQIYMGKLSANFRYQTALRTDERIRFIDEIISGIQVIKMYAWEQPFTNLVTLARKLELKVVLKNAYIRAIYMTLILFNTRMALFCTMLSIALIYGRENIIAARIFVITAYFTILSKTMSEFIRGISELAEVSVAFKRIQNFLECEEKCDEMHISRHAAHEKKSLYLENLQCRNIALVAKQVTARWNVPKKEINAKMKEARQISEQQKCTLQNIDLEIQKGKLIGIIGAVGAGKSSLLHVLLRELPLESGSISINGSVSFSCQETWVFASSVRQNILFGQKMDHERYEQVVKACALQPDFDQFEHGDQTIIGDRGATLSGGQKARINLARAVYRKADIYLLDDPLSAVDTHVGRHIFEECIGYNGLLARQRATRVLVTHQVHFLNSADWIVFLEDGKIKAQGPPADLAEKVIRFERIIDHSMRRDSKVKNEPNQPNVIHDEKTYHEVEENDKDSLKAFHMEANSEGREQGSIILNYFGAGASSSVLITLFLFFLLTQVLASVADYWVSYWTSQEELRIRGSDLIKNYSIVVKTMEINRDTEVIKESVYVDSIVVTDSNDLLSTKLCMIIHGSIIFGLFVFCIIRSVWFFNVCAKASQFLHDSLFKGIINTTMQFFDRNPSGIILNRCTKDMGSIDEYLPKTVSDLAQCLLNILGAFLTAVAVNPIFIIPSALITTGFLFLRRRYIKASKDIKRLEGITKSPIFTHLSATLNGLSTIRAFHAEANLEKEFDYYQDNNSACLFMLISTSNAFGLALDLMTATFIMSILFTFFFIDTGVTGSKVGLAITQAMTITGLFQWAIRQSAEVVNQLVHVERVLEYCDMEVEKNPKKAIEMPKSWPKEGKIEFRNVFYRYDEGTEPILKGLSFIVRPKEKIGIVGRTGAGKSSMIGAIFRLAVVEGDILVDDINTSVVPLKDLRSKIAIIPQDPVIFSGSLRSNLDPFEDYSDAEIWTALADVGMKNVASNSMGLDTQMKTRGINISVGERQLLCLARAILRKNKIVVLDEATANVDQYTDLMIQQTIRTVFADCTVLTVAHRLHTIMDSDRVLVLDNGKLIEFDKPHILLKNEDSAFQNMTIALGSNEFSHLLQIAKQKHKATKKDA